MDIEWKQFRNTYYSVSDTGLVRNDMTNKILSAGINSNGYYNVILHINKRKYTYDVHILVGIVFLGFISNGRKNVIHHIDGIKTNNYKNNLKIITFRANCSIERTIKSTSKYVGVTWYKNYSKWRAAIRLNKKLIHLGYFKNELDAHNAYQKALKSVEEFGVV